MPEPTYTLLATLGGQPQVVTFTLDLLLQRGSHISEVIVVHPAPFDPHLQHSLRCLNAEFANNCYQFNGQSFRCHFYSHILQHHDQPLGDIVDSLCADGVVDTIYSLIRSLKQQGRSIHLSITGGRRMMSSLAVSAALLHFKHTDHIWHIYTPEELRKQANVGALMHVPPGRSVNLIEVPFVPWGTYIAGLPQPGESAQAARTSQFAQAKAQQHSHCATVMKKASKREQEVLRLFAEGLRPQEVATRLDRTVKTIDTYKTRLLEYCHEVWDIERSIRLDYHFLYEKFSSYFESHE